MISVQVNVYKQYGAVYFNVQNAKLGQELLTITCEKGSWKNITKGADTAITRSEAVALLSRVRANFNASLTVIRPRYKKAV